MALKGIRQNIKEKPTRSRTSRLISHPKKGRVVPNHEQNPSDEEQKKDELVESFARQRMADVSNERVDSSQVLVPSISQTRMKQNPFQSHDNKCEKARRLELGRVLIQNHNLTNLSVSSRIDLNKTIKPTTKFPQQTKSSQALANSNDKENVVKSGG